MDDCLGDVLMETLLGVGVYLVVYGRYKVNFSISAKMIAVVNSLVHKPISIVEGSFFSTSPVCSVVNFLGDSHYH